MRKAISFLITVSLIGLAAYVVIAPSTGPRSPYDLDNRTTGQSFVEQETGVISSFPLSTYAGNDFPNQRSIAVGTKAVTTHGYIPPSNAGQLAGQYSPRGTPNGASHNWYSTSPVYADEGKYDGADRTQNSSVQ